MAPAESGDAADLHQMDVDLNLEGEELLQKAAADGLWSDERWPQALRYIIARLDTTVRMEFVLPVRPPETPPPLPLGSPAPEGQSSQDSTRSNKENDPSHSTSMPPIPPERALVPATSDNEADPDEFWPADFPPDLAALYNGIKKRLSANFPKNPPHTVQRLAELVLAPKRSYRFLPPYLRALDRVVSVSSSTQVFPMPQAQLPICNNSFLNGAGSVPSTSRRAPELGSDESLGGALLTPIPWLASAGSASSSISSQNEKELQTSSTEIVEGPNGAGRIETVSVINGSVTSFASVNTIGVSNYTPGSSSEVEATEEALRAEGAVTQGELLRQEQEAGVVSIGPHAIGIADEGAIVDEAEEEKPHARGPEEIGLADIGQQDRPVGSHLDLEAAVGRGRREGSVDPEDASLSDAGGGREEELKEAESQDLVPDTDVEGAVEAEESSGQEQA